MIMHTFSCSNGHINEKLVKMDTKEVECPDCDQIATKVIGCPKIKTDSWKSTRKWAKQRETQVKYERKHGITLQT
tara:strand:- start:2275 stop:2499 length:225 start_codon:yes stop_codon:yes gene_type:complete